ncbi:MAG: M15 family metallopeptidase [Chitinophagaceae bacterium]
MIDKIPFRYYISTAALLFFLLPGIAKAQQLSTSPYGVQVWDNIAGFRQSVQADSLKKMLSLRSLIPDIVLDLRYATRNNFMRRRMYPQRTNNTFLRAPAAQALLLVQQELHRNGYGLKIFDAYRPYAVTVSFWELVKDERYVANPSKGSGHNRGLAVDLTIIDLKTGKELDMGTGFDNFSDSAHHNFTQLPQSVLQNRSLLKETMQKYGFTLLETEWWHYYWKNDRNYEVLDIPFSKLEH